MTIVTFDLYTLYDRYSIYIRDTVTKLPYCENAWQE